MEKINGGVKESETVYVAQTLSLWRSCRQLLFLLTSAYLQSTAWGPATSPDHFSCFHQCVDLSCNELSEITLPENLPPKLQELDLTGNPRLALDHKSLELLK